jgi:hypothetical protein
MKVNVWTDKDNGYNELVTTWETKETNPKLVLIDLPLKDNGKYEYELYDEEDKTVLDLIRSDILID